MSTISVIVPVYKVEAYLHRCVGSILAQTFGDFDLVLVDDGSPDNCGRLCEELSKTDSRIQVIHQENGGLSAARNTGIEWAMENSGSQFLAFIDSDDWVDRTYLEQLYRAATEGGVRLSVCGLYRTAGESREDSPAYACQVMAVEDYYCSPTIHGGVTAVAWNKLYHKSLFQTRRYPVGRLHEDEFTTYRLVYEAGTVAVVPGALYAYFQNDSGIMRSKWSPRRMDALEAMEGQMAFAQAEHHPALLQKAAKQYIYAVHDQLSQADSSYRPVLRKKLRFGLKQGRLCGAFPRTRQTRWAYEEAYPMKPVWWLLSKLERRDGHA
ncbi:MAG: glycosyltransferase family 2 protein [Eubacteriales bacterium]|nr:glycosyltransferase family 2 protein [Eubacteriales bacterium]